jgi:UTP:GlnB (protein PII) uridylyltransferase
MARRLSEIIDEAVRCVLNEMEMPEEATIVAVGANGREETTVRSDLDLICYVPNVSDFE